MANKGNYYKYRTKSWLEKKGYKVGFLERMQRIYTKGRIIPVKKDQFASDLLAVSSDEIIFIQVKFNSKVESKNVAEAVKEFHKFAFPKWAKKWIVVWQPRIREPNIIEI